MPHGTISVAKLERGFGFIVPSDSSEDVFFHVSGLQGVDLDDQLVGRRVQYEIGVDARNGKTRAVNVRAEK